jgi:hypothetical protein
MRMRSLALASVAVLLAVPGGPTSLCSRPIPLPES